jgi:hypothetical protein
MGADERVSTTIIATSDTTPSTIDQNSVHQESQANAGEKKARHVKSAALTFNAVAYKNAPKNDRH